MRFRLLISIVFMAGLSSAAFAAPKNRLVLKYTVEEGLKGRPAVEATFKASINGGRPVVGMTDEHGQVALDLGRALHKGDTLYVEAESSDGNRAYSWTYGETPLTGEVEENCQLVGAIDFTQPTLASAR